MKNNILLLIIIPFVISCEMEKNEPENSKIPQFVYELKNGTYNKYKSSNDGTLLWTELPELSKNDAILLIMMASDTSLITPCDHFPTNPISSIPPYRLNANEKPSIMLGEYLLWCAEIAVFESFPSLCPVLKKSEQNSQYFLSGKEVLKVRKIFQDWWEKNKKQENITVRPLHEKDYKWL